MKFISKDLAIKLKEKGFYLPTLEIIGKYDSDGIFHSQLYCNHTETMDCDEIITPTIEQVIEWLREEKNIFIWMKPYHTYATKNNICWDWNISIVNNTHELSKYCSDEGFAKYENACIAGIEYVINNLI